MRAPDGFDGDFPSGIIKFNLAKQAWPVKGIMLPRNRDAHLFIDFLA
jgi:hypothetical protein